MQILSCLRHGVRHGLRRADGCSEQLEVLYAEIQQWKRENQGADMTGLIVVGCDEESEDEE